MEVIKKAWGVTNPPCSDGFYFKEISGWKVCLDKKLTSADSMTSPTIEKLASDFKKIQEVLEPERYNFMKNGAKIELSYEAAIRSLKPVLPCPESTCDGLLKFSWPPVKHLTAFEFIILDSNSQPHVY